MSNSASEEVEASAAAEAIDPWEKPSPAQTEFLAERSQRFHGLGTPRSSSDSTDRKPSAKKPSIATFRKNILKRVMKLTTFATDMNSNTFTVSLKSESIEFDASETQKIPRVKAGPVRKENSADRVQPYTRGSVRSGEATPQTSKKTGGRRRQVAPPIVKPTESQ